MRSRLVTYGLWGPLAILLVVAIVIMAADYFRW
jgi:hypothetical protein